MVNKLYLAPEQSGYTVKAGDEVVRTQLDGGAGRYRRDILNASRMVTCKWLLSEGEFQYINAFYQTSIANGSVPFLIDLILQSSSLVEHQAYFMPRSYKVSKVKGESYSVSATLEVTPVPSDDSVNQAILLFYTQEGDNGTVIPELEKLINVTMPSLKAWSP